MAFGRRGIAGQWLAELGLAIPFTTTAVVLAQIFVAVPFFVRAAKSGFARIDHDVEEAAGRPRRHAVARLLAGHVAAGPAGANRGRRAGPGPGRWASSAPRSCSPATCPGVTQTMPLAIYGRYGAGDLQAALLLALVLLGASLAILLGVRALDR